MAKLFQCDGIVTRTVHVKLEAEDKQDAADKAFKLFVEDGSSLLLSGQNPDLWVGPEEQDVDEDIEVSMALDGPYEYWDVVEIITAKCK